uniref:Uncharacterized protein n=1 Tax=Sphaerodactylus townsendi TaxID=933632 RepID=A0ACB8EEL1_9SAUR
MKPPCSEAVYPKVSDAGNKQEGRGASFLPRPVDFLPSCWETRWPFGLMHLSVPEVPKTGSWAQANEPGAQGNCEQHMLGRETVGTSRHMPPSVPASPISPPPHLFQHLPFPGCLFLPRQVCVPDTQCQLRPICSQAPTEKPCFFFKSFTSASPFNPHTRSSDRALTCRSPGSVAGTWGSSTAERNYRMGARRPPAKHCWSNLGPV